MQDKVIVVNLGNNPQVQDNRPHGFWEWFFVIMFYLIVGFPLWLLIYLVCGIIYGLTMQAFGLL